MSLRGLDGKVAVVTGGGSGIGQATSRRLSSEGCKVAVVDIDEITAEKTAASLDGEAVAIGADVSTVEGVRAYVDRSVEAFGRIDLFHNNAGIGGDLAPIWETDVEAFDRVMAVNSRGAWLGLRAVLAQMAAQGGGGAVVNTASLAGLRGNPGLSPYCMSKHAVAGLTKTAAIEAAPLKVRVNAICPGLVHTPMLQGLIEVVPKEFIDGAVARVPVGRMAEPPEIADMVAWLLSEESGYVTGQCVVIDGGIAAA